LIGTRAAAARPRRSDAGQARLTERDINGVLLVAEQYAAPYGLLTEALAVPPARCGRSPPAGTWLASAMAAWHSRGFPSGGESQFAWAAGVEGWGICGRTGFGSM
jgi:hypothetical protein